MSNLKQFKMKNLLTVLLLCTTFTFATNPTSSNIQKVTVYINGAQITRTAILELPVGTTQFTLEKLSPYIQESSIQISGLNEASILSINFGINYLSKPLTDKKIENLQLQIKAIRDKIQFEDGLIAGYKEELNVIQTNRRLGNDSQVVSLEKLQQFASYYRKRITAINTAVYQSEKKKVMLKDSIENIKMQLAEFNAGDEVQTGEITLKLNTVKAQTLHVTIKYNVSNAGWFPVYDLKATKINAPIQLAYKAHVYQTTGNNWKNIKLTLSTGDPNTNNNKPDLQPKYLNFINRYSTYNRNRATKRVPYKYNPFIQSISGIVTDESGPLPGVSVVIKGTSIGTQTDFNGRYTLKANGGKELQFSFVGMQTETLPIYSSAMNVNLEADHNVLDEVVVSAYGKKKSPASIYSALAGKARGINIRGYSSVKANANLLFVVDGIPVDKSFYNNLNEGDIESVEVLRGASASSLYGNRAKNGVIVIKTKKNKATSNGDIIEQGITNTRFEIKKEYSIPTDGNITVIEIDNYSVPANYAYVTAPIINENVFLTAKIGNWEQYNLLPGEANVYFEGSYSGKTIINPQAVTDSLTVSLGSDPAIVVKRTQFNNFKKNSFIGNNKFINRAYEIEIKNNKNSTVMLTISDRIPVSQHKDIKVETIETGTAIYQRKKGLLTWTLQLPANQSKKVGFSYTLKYPKYKRVNL
jgi:TonB-dependent SusC/RagA subfamily outer membrane receptor